MSAIGTKPTGTELISPEGLQGSDNGQRMEEAVSAFEDALGSIEEIDGSLQEIVEQ